MERPLLWTPNLRHLRDPPCSVARDSPSQNILEIVFIMSQVQCLPPQAPFGWRPKGRHVTGLI